MIVFLSGKFKDAGQAEVSALAPGLLCGIGVFETMRSLRRRIAYLEAHLNRLRRSCRALNLNLAYSADKLKAAIRGTVNVNRLNDAYVRLTVFKSGRGADLLVIARPYQAYPAAKYRRGFSLGVAGLRQTSNSLFAQIKSTSRLFYELAYQEAGKRGFDEALILNEKGNIAEGSRSNIFFVKDGEIFTPSLECGCLAGITRQVVFDSAPKAGARVNEGKFTVYDLYDAGEVFLTNSLIGIMPVSRIEKQLLPSGKITAGLMKRYQRILKNEV
jgi:branched-subunit amino acid aminotransferase/4-amino-4-deoxychorismate lyase